MKEGIKGKAQRMKEDEKENWRECRVKAEGQKVQRKQNGSNKICRKEKRK